MRVEVGNRNSVSMENNPPPPSSRFNHIMCPGPTGWSFVSDVTVEIGKLPVKAGLLYLVGFEKRTVKMNGFRNES